MSARSPLVRTCLMVALIALGLASMGSTCASSRYHAVSLAPQEGVQSWSRAVQDWSREHKVYYWMDDKIWARATYHSPAFRKAFIDHRGSFYGDFTNALKKELVDLGGGEAEYWHSFFISAYVGTQRYRQLAHADTIWSIYLVNDKGVRVTAEKIRPVRVNPSVKSVYPYVDRFDRAYFVRFPLADNDGRPIIDRETRQFELHISSAYAEAVMYWDLIPSGTPEGYGAPRDAGPPDAAPAKDDDDGFGLGKILGG